MNVNLEQNEIKELLYAIRMYEQHTKEENKELIDIVQRSCRGGCCDLRRT